MDVNTFGNEEEKLQEVKQESYSKQKVLEGKLEEIRTTHRNKIVFQEGLGMAAALQENLQEWIFQVK